MSSRSFKTGQKGGPVIREESSFKDQEPRFSSNLEAIRLSHPHISAQTSRSNQESFRILSGSRFGPLNSFLSKATTEASFKGVLKYGKNKASFEGLVSPKSAHDQEVLLRKLCVPETQPGFARVGPNPPSQISPRSEAENEEPQRSIKNSQLNQASSPVVGQESTFMTGILSRRQMHQAKLSEVGTQSVKVHEYKPSDLSCAISTDQPMMGKLKDSPKPSPNYLLRTPLDPNTFGGLAEQTEKEIWKKKRSKRGREQKDGVFFNKIKHYSRIFNPKEKSSLVFGKLGKTAGGGLQAIDVLETPHIGRMGNKPTQLNLAVGTSLKDKPAESKGSLETRSQFQRKKREIEQINERIITYSTFSVPNTAWGDYKPYQKEIEKIESKATGNLGSTKPMSVVELWSRDFHGDIMSKAEHKKFRMRIQRYLHVLHRQGQGNASISKLMLQTTTNVAKD